jgi:hypothetical protein
MIIGKDWVVWEDRLYVYICKHMNVDSCKQQNANKVPSGCGSLPYFLRRQASGGTSLGAFGHPRRP